MEQLDILLNNKIAAVACYSDICIFHIFSAAYGSGAVSKWVSV